MRTEIASVMLALPLLFFSITDSLALDPPAPAAGVPTNYRLVLAEYIAARESHVVRDAQITKPYERWGGLLRGGSFTAFCVAVFRDNPFGIVVRDNWVLHFEDGRVRQAAMGMESCSDLSPFPELMKAIASRRPR